MSTIRRLVLYGLGTGLMLIAGSAVRGEPQQAAGPKLNVFEGRVFANDGTTPVPLAYLAVAEVETGFISGGGPGEVFAGAPNEKVLLFFTKVNGRRSHVGQADAEGRFRIEGLKAGNYMLVASSEQHGVVILTKVTQPNEGNPLKVVLTAPTFVEGTIRGLALDPLITYAALRPSSAVPWLPNPGDAPRIFYQPQLGLDSQGKFRSAPLPAGGKWSLVVDQHVLARNFAATILERPVEVEVGKSAVIEVDLTTGQRIEGRITGPTGEPLPDVVVTARPTASSETGYAYGAVTRSDGSYAIGGLASGDYRLEAKRWAVRTGFG